MVTKYSNTKSDSLAQISTPMAETQNFFQGIVFYWHTLQNVNNVGLVVIFLGGMGFFNRDTLLQICYREFTVKEQTVFPNTLQILGDRVRLSLFAQANRVLLRRANGVYKENNCIRCAVISTCKLLLLQHDVYNYLARPVNLFGGLYVFLALISSFLITYCRPIILGST